jgi:Fe-S cluster biogenesis protein NfuA
MINKKLITGILTIVVVLAAVQGIKPVLGDNSGSSTLLISVKSGEGKVCWSGAATGCTDSSSTLNLQNGATLTFAATPTNGYAFVDWYSGSPSTGVYSHLNTFTVTINGDGQYIFADFSQTQGDGY